MRLAVDRRKVVHETIDGEAILIHMETGFYYSLEGTGSEIWELVVAGSEPDEISERLRLRYDAPPGAVEEAVESLIGGLLDEGLVVEVDAAPDDGPIEPRALPAEDPAPARAAFVAPVLHRYTDMADFMLVDPIHEVEESGWPDRKVAP